MRLHIHPSSLWIAYGIRRPSEVQARLPANLRLASVPLYANDKRPSPKLLFNAYDVTSEPRYMHGHRIDVQTIAYDTRRHTVHLVVLDCLTDAAHWDPSTGIRMYGNARCSRPSRGVGDDYTLHVTSLRDRGVLSLRARRGERRAVGWRFAVEANRKCYFRDLAAPFQMVFDEANVGRPVRELSVRTLTNTFWARERYEAPSHVFVHEQAMSFAMVNLTNFA